MAAGLKAALQGVVDHLVAGGVAAASDPAEVNTPGVWVWPGIARPDRLDGNGDLEVHLQLVAPDVSAPDALQLLDELLGDVLDLVSPEGDIVPQSVILPGSPNTLPSYGVVVLATYERTGD